ncbi:MAG: complex I NDUFA9 subunit family protein [Acetobacteraceae bacterium]|nr:complex I NDUFA9 subunit family protein [Acetobacteraceae bacterium]
MLATVFGGTGFLGRRVVGHLAQNGMMVRVAVRRPERVDAGAMSGGSGRLIAVAADIRDSASVSTAVAGADAVVNAISAYVEKAGVTYTAVHVKGAGNVAIACARQGVRRLLHVSGIGADAASHAPYIRARGQGEHAVRQAFPDATIIRPSVMFAAQDAFLRSLASIIRATPVIPLIAGGRTRLQPVHVSDVAAAICLCIADPATCDKVYELGGPETYSLREIIRRIAAALGRRPLLVPVPFLLARSTARLLELLPNPPLTVAQVDLLKYDNIAATDVSDAVGLGTKIPRRYLQETITKLAF